MKVLISALVTLSVGTAMAATSTVNATNTGSTSTRLQTVAPKASPLSFKYEAYVEKSQASIDDNKDNIKNDNDFKATYKLTDSQSLRLRPQFKNTVVEAGGKTETKTRMGETYLQYVHSGIANVATQPLDFVVRTYIPTSEAEKNSGRFNQTRLYLSSDFKLNERVTVTPYLNPRFYSGSSKFQDKNSNLSYLMVTLVETEVALNDRFSWTIDLARFDYGFQGKQANGKDTKDTFYIESWISAVLADKTSITEKISIDVGFFNENSGNGISMSKDSGELAYFSRLHVNF